jgi:ankyrin repeat protein
MRRIGVLAILMVTVLAFVGWQYGQVRQRRLNSPLWEAIQQSDPSAAERALAAGANPNAYASYVWPIDVYSYSVLSGAVEHGDEGIVAVLLKAGANPNSTGRWKTPALCEATQRQKWGIARKLLKAGADPSKKDPYGRTPLYFAAREGKTELVQLLLAAGASPKDSVSADSAIQIAREKGHEKVVRLLVAARAQKR